jgi:hypothetical protein
VAAGGAAAVGAPNDGTNSLAAAERVNALANGLSVDFFTSGLPSAAFSSTFPGGGPV